MESENRMRGEGRGGKRKERGREIEGKRDKDRAMRGDRESAMRQEGAEDDDPS